MQNEKQNQQKAVLDCVLNHNGPIRTDEVRIICFKLGISCADTYLRILAREGKIERFWEVVEKDGVLMHKHKTKSWCSPAYYKQMQKDKAAA